MKETLFQDLVSAPLFASALSRTQFPEDIDVLDSKSQSCQIYFPSRQAAWRFRLVILQCWEDRASRDQSVKLHLENIPRLQWAKRARGIFPLKLVEIILQRSSVLAAVILCSRNFTPCQFCSKIKHLQRGLRSHHHTGVCVQASTYSPPHLQPTSEQESSGQNLSEVLQNIKRNSED